MKLKDKFFNYFRLNRKSTLHTKRHYGGASQGRRFKGWTSPDTSATASITPALATLRQRSRDLVRNNPYAERAVRAITASLIGGGIVPQARSCHKTVNAHLDDLWDQWGETTDGDADNLQNFYGLQQLAVRALVESGECLIRRRRRRASDRLPLPLQLQLLEADFIDTSRDTLNKPLANGNEIIQGIEFNKLGKRVAYWLYPQHPGGGTTIHLTSKRIKAEDIIHLYRIDRPGQVRGVPWSAPIMVKLKDLDDYDQAELVRHKIAACFAGFVRDTEFSDRAKPETLINDKFEPGILEILPPGKDISFSNPPQVQGYQEYVNSNLRAIAAGFSIPYELLTGDYSQVNFSSARMGALSFHRQIEQWQKQLIIPRLCQKVWEWFVQAALLQYSMDGLDVNPCPKVVWTPPRRDFIDPVKEVQALKEQVRCGFISLSEVMRTFGLDPGDQFQAIAEDAKSLDALGLRLDSDPRDKHTKKENL